MPTTRARSSVSFALGVFFTGAGAAHADADTTSNATPMRAHADDVVDYTLRATLDPAAHTVHGEGTLRWRNTSRAPVTELWVHLYMNAFKNERSVYMREPVGGFRGGAPVATWGTIDVESFVLQSDKSRNEPSGAASGVDLWPSADLRAGDGEGDDETDVRVPLPGGQTILPGESVTISMRWTDHLPSIVERTGFDGSMHMVAQWFPKLARLENDGHWAHFPFHHLAEFYADFGTYDVTVDVPAGFVVGACGPLVESRDESGRHSERHVQKDIHDFAWTAWDQWHVATDSVGPVALRILFPPGYDEAAQRELAAMHFALPYFGDRYGAYPYDVLTLVHPPSTAEEAGGMEYPTLITTGGPWWSGTRAAAGIENLELITIHEFGHQYFYGLLASDEVMSPFLDEGINSFAEADTLAAMHGSASVFSFLDLRVSDGLAGAALSNRVAHAAPVAEPAFRFATGGEYAGLVYQRTAAILETFRRVYGDEPVRRALGDYARSQRFLHPTEDDLVAAFAAVLGPAAEKNLQVALNERGWVDYRVTAMHAAATKPARGLFDRDGKRETIASGASGASGAARSSATSDASANPYEGWVLVERRGTLQFPVNVELTLASGAKRRLVWDGVGDSVRLPYEGTEPLVSARVDPDDSVLLDEDRTNDFAVASDDGVAGGGAPRTWERVAYWAEILVQMIMP